jgi:predicted enzyme related to lactoylglutathione lyase
MVKRDSAPAGAPCWIDLFTTDPDASKSFYGELFGWTAEDAGPEYGNYINFSKDGVRVAGGMQNDGSGGPDAWSVYLATDDAKATADLAQAEGGQIIVPPMDVGTLGTMLLLSDPGQAAIGAWQPQDFPGFGVWGEDGTPGWFELHTRNYDAAVRFYERVFGWDTHVMGDTDDFRYTTLGEGENQLAGIMDATISLPESVPAHWAVYFAVTDTDATVDRAVELGATVVSPAMDTPYGRLATLADPTGAGFRLGSIT